MTENQDDKHKTKIGAILLFIFVIGILVASGLVVASWRNKNEQVAKSVETPVIVTVLSEKQEKDLDDFISKAKEKNKGKVSGKPPRGQQVNTTGKGNGSENSEMANADKSLAILFDYGSANGNGKAFLKKIMQVSNEFSLPLNEENLESAEVFQLVYNFIKEIPEEKRQTAKFRLYGYTDTAFRNGVPDQGEESRIFNERLSQKRAESIKDILEELNVPSENISIVKGCGFENLVYENKMENPEKSRRVEVFCNYEKEQSDSNNRSWFDRLFGFLFKK